MTIDDLERLKRFDEARADLEVALRNARRALTALDIVLDRITDGPTTIFVDTTLWRDDW